MTGEEWYYGFRLRSTSPETRGATLHAILKMQIGKGMKFLDRKVLHAGTAHDVSTNWLKIVFTLAGGIPHPLRDVAGNPPSPESLMGLTCDGVRYIPDTDTTTVILRGNFDTFMEYGGQMLSPDSQTSDEESLVAELEQQIADLQSAGLEGEETMTDEMNEDSVLADVKENALLAGKAVMSDAALDAALTVLVNKLASMGIDTRILTTPGTRNLIKMALPALIMFALDVELVKRALPEGARSVARDAANSAQLAASIQAMKALADLVVPMIMAFVAASAAGTVPVSGQLSAGDNGQLINDMLRNAVPVPTESP